MPAPSRPTRLIVTVTHVEERVVDGPDGTQENTYRLTAKSEEYKLVLTASRPFEIFKPDMHLEVRVLPGE